MSPSGEPPALFVFLSAYVMGKECADPKAAVLEELEAGEQASWPGFRTLARVRKLVAPVLVAVNHSSLIAKARSIALGSFLESGAPRMLSIDDDVEANEDDLRKLLDASDVDLLIAPCALRGGPVPALNIVTSEGGPGRVREVAPGVRVFEVASGGFALSVLSRAAAEVLYLAHPELRFVDQDGRRGLAVFLEELRGGSWVGEDFAACARARQSGLRIEALRDSAVTHAGVMATVDPRFFLSSDTISE